MYEPKKVPLKQPFAGYRACHPWLMIDPQNPPAILAEEDELTRQVDAVMHLAIPFNCYKGVHTTPFGKESDNRDYKITMPKKEWPIITNSLAPYYIRHHRQDISQNDLQLLEHMVNALDIEVDGPEM